MKNTASAVSLTNEISAEDGIVETRTVRHRQISLLTI